MQTLYILLAICIFALSKGGNEMEDKYKIPYVNACIRAFAVRFSLTVQAAFRYLNRFKGIEFLDEFYDVEHLLSINDAVDELALICKKNGGQLI